MHGDLVMVMKAKPSTRRCDPYLLLVASASGILGSGIRNGFKHCLNFGICCGQTAGAQRRQGYALMK